MITIALIGTGGIAHKHLQSWLLFPDRCLVIALVNRTAARAEAFRSEYCLQAAVFTELTDALALHPDLVDICTPPAAHADLTVQALQAGCHVVVEKPMALSLEDCDRMLRAREASGKTLSVIAQNRFRRDMRDLKAMLDSGIAGRLRHAHVNGFFLRGRSYYDLAWRGTWEGEGGGCTINQGIHFLDLMIWMAGMPDRITAVLANTGHDNSETEDISVAVMEYPGALATFTASVVEHGQEQGIVLQCEKAKLACPGGVFASQYREDGFPLPEGDPAFAQQADAFLRSLPPVPYERMDGQLEEVLSALEQGKAPAVSGEDGRRAVELVTSIYQAGSTHERVALPIREDNPFYTLHGLRARVSHFH